MRRHQVQSDRRRSTCRSTNGRRGLALVALASLVACSPGDPSANSVAEPTSTSTDAASTTTSTVEESTTTAPAATTSSASPTTVESPEDIEAQIRADFTATLDAYHECVIQPETCDFSAVAAAGSPVDQTLRHAVEVLLTENLRGRRGSGPQVLRFEKIEVLDSTAEVTTCIVDGGVVYDIGDPADPSDDVVINDSLVSTRTLWTMVQIDGRWLRRDLRVISTYPDQESCVG